MTYQTGDGKTTNQSLKNLELAGGLVKCECSCWDCIRGNHLDCVKDWPDQHKEDSK